MEYSQTSKDLTNKLSKEIKQKAGIYFTPPSCIQTNIELLKPYMNASSMFSVLEPSCGSGEYITALHASFSHLNITGIEWNETIYNSIQHLNQNNITIHHADFLEYNPNPIQNPPTSIQQPKKYDLIIGNPPYFVMKKEDVKKEYRPYFDGRPNIFILFIIKSLQLLNNGGILSFILPKNFMNCLYYDKTRKYIADHFQILTIADCTQDKYIETQQETILLIVRKQENLTTVNNTAFLLSTNNYTIFMTESDLPKIKALYQNSTSLHHLGFNVHVGTVVWNQCKAILTNDAQKTLLIYSSDIQDNTLQIKTYNNEAKKNYIHKPGIHRPMIVINRGYGTGEYKFNYCLIDMAKEYLVENHLICIESVNPDLTHDELIIAYKKVIQSLNDIRTHTFIQTYFGNSAINTTELNWILPIYVA